MGFEQFHGMGVECGVITVSFHCTACTNTNGGLDHQFACRNRRPIKLFRSLKDDGGWQHMNPFLSKADQVLLMGIPSNDNGEILQACDGIDLTHPLQKSIGMGRVVPRYANKLGGGPIGCGRFPWGSVRGNIKFTQNRDQ